MAGDTVLAGNQVAGGLAISLSTVVATLAVAHNSAMVEARRLPAKSHVATLAVFCRKHMVVGLARSHGIVVAA